MVTNWEKNMARDIANLQRTTDEHTGFDYKAGQKTTLAKLETRVIRRSSLLYSSIYAVSKMWFY